VVAKTDPAAGKVEWPQLQLMVRALLEDRFQLRYHTETKEMSVLSLVVAKKGAVDLIECKDHNHPAELVPGDNRQMTFHHMSIVGLVNTMANILQTPVVDGTGITGYYDFTLDPNHFANQDPGDAAHKETFGDLVIAAVHEQLGLRLEKKKASLDITIIDRAEHPSAN
jgi:uncharacterized protein (TIGR03435 family)